jgi:hypothetical protein
VVVVVVIVTITYSSRSLPRQARHLNLRPSVCVRGSLLTEVVLSARRVPLITRLNYLNMYKTLVKYITIRT